MFERYTEKARRVIFFARYEASQFGSPYIETEHLLLGLLREDKTLANRFLRSHAAVDSIRRQIEERSTLREKVSSSVDLPLSHDCKRILTYGAEESERLRHKHIGTEHLLIGVLKEEKSFAAELLMERGLRLSRVRQELENTPPEAPQEVAPQPRIDWGRFAKPAGLATFLAHKEAHELRSRTIEVEHLLLGVLQEDHLAVTLPLRSDASLEEIRRKIAEHTQPTRMISFVAQPLMSPRFLRAMAFACEESGSLKVDTGHLILAILHEENSLAAGILRDAGVSPSAVSEELTGG